MPTPFFFAHAGELHQGNYQTTAHLLFGRWYIALLLLGLLLLIVGRLTSIITRGSKSAIFNMVMTTLLIAGMFSYSLSSVISVVSLSVGFALALGQVLLGLGWQQPDKKNNSEEE